MAHDVFISYSSKDKTIADAVCAKLEAAGIRCWIAPRDIPAGSNYPGEIVRAIETSRAAVLVFSENANRSKWVMSEIERAAHNNVIIIPFRVEDVQPAPDIEILIALQHWLDAITPPLERHLHELIRVVSRILGQTPPVVLDLALTPAQAHRGGRKGAEIDGKAYSVTFGPGLADGQEVGLTRADALNGTEKTASRNGRFVTVAVSPLDRQPVPGADDPVPASGQVTLVFHVPPPMPVKKRRILGTVVATVLLTILSVWGYHNALNSELWDAAYNGPPEEAKRLLDKGADVNMADNLGRTPIMEASYYGNADTVEVLVAHHANVNARAQTGETALLNASSYSNYSAPGYNPQNNIRIINLLLDHGADVNARNPKKQTPLLLNLGLSGGDVDVLAHLIERGADVNAVDNEGYTPLTLAAQRGYTATADALLKRGAKADYQNSEGYTAMMYAAMHGFDLTINVLLNHHADPNLQTKKHRTALCFACAAPDISYSNAYQGYEATISHLIAAGGQVNVTDSDGNTPLSLAQQYIGKNNSIVQRLLRAGALPASHAHTNPTRSSTPDSLPPSQPSSAVNDRELWR